jgi:hypothetical protein
MVGVAGQGVRASERASRNCQRLLAEICRMHRGPLRHRYRIQAGMSEDTARELTFAPDIASLRPMATLPRETALLKQSSISATTLYHPSDSSRYGLTAMTFPLSSTLGGEWRIAVIHKTNGKLGDESCSCIRRMMGRCAWPISRS